MILLTGGAGFIGSHTLVELLQAGKEVVVLDSFCNSNPSVFNRVAQITGKSPVCWVRGDVRDTQALDGLFRQYPIRQVVHFAGLKAIGESVADPVRYYDNNVLGTLMLLAAMERHDVTDLVFSSSATVHGAGQALPLREDAPFAPTNPYAETKAAVETLLANRAQHNLNWRIARLRYFNPAGAHPSGLIGESPRGTPNNLVPYINQVATGRWPSLQVFGKTYPTPDGTGVRDYLHVVDLAKGHLVALDWLARQGNTCEAFNLGTGRGHSVLEVVQAYRDASGHAIPVDFVSHRAGDIATCYANADKAQAVLGWRAEQGLAEICQDAWRWAQNEAKRPT